MNKISFTYATVLWSFLEVGDDGRSEAQKEHGLRLPLCVYNKYYEIGY